MIPAAHRCRLDARAQKDGYVRMQFQLWGKNTENLARSVFMDMQRAQEYLRVPNYIVVNYEGMSVRIDRLFESSPFAHISYENGATTNVPVSELHEDKSIH